jgi:glycosyl-4,4'-diaponeurosporenoate acyltransferase
MQIFFLPEGLTIAICFLLWPIFQFFFSYICFRLSDNFYKKKNGLFKIFRWEKNGYIYEYIFKIKNWKQLLPDGAEILGLGYRKKNLTDFSIENLNRFIIESRRAELSHWLAITPFWVFGFFTPNHVIVLMFIYSLLVNFPCIITQRYNRPRIERIIDRIKYDNVENTTI